MVIGFNGSCSDTTFANVVINTSLAVGIMPQSPELCAGESILLTASGASAYHWTPITGLTSVNAGTVLASPSMTTTYTVVGSGSGCTDTSQVVVQVHPRPMADFSVNPSIVSIFYPVVNFTNLTISSSPTSWQWSMGNGAHAITKHVEYTYHDTGTYNVILIAKNQFGCSDTVSHQVIVKPDHTLYVPNSFTPDDNSVNDFFDIYGTGISKYSIYIFNRWGEMIFESGDLQKSWDGNYLGDDCPKGTYVYKILYEDLTGLKYQKTGRVNLLR
jgi:gliding motility-associated-like protein